MPKYDGHAKIPSLNQGELDFLWFYKAKYLNKIIYTFLY